MPAINQHQHVAAIEDQSHLLNGDMWLRHAANFKLEIGGGGAGPRRTEAWPGVSWGPDDDSGERGGEMYGPEQSLMKHHIELQALAAAQILPVE